MIGKTEVVVAAKTDDFFVIKNYFDLLRAFDNTALAVTMLPFFFIQCRAEIFQVTGKMLATAAGRLFAAGLENLFGVQAESREQLLVVVLIRVIGG